MDRIERKIILRLDGQGDTSTIEFAADTNTVCIEVRGPRDSFRSVDFFNASDLRTIVNELSYLANFAEAGETECK